MAQDIQEILNGLVKGGSNEETINAVLELVKSGINLDIEFKTILEQLPQCVWILESDKIYFDNSHARAQAKLLPYIKGMIEDALIKPIELNVDEKVFLVNAHIINTKTFIYVIDITDQKYKEHLMLLGQVSAYLAHEFKNPIAAIANFLNCLEEGIKGEVGAQKLLQILDSIKHPISRIERTMKAILCLPEGFLVNKSEFKLQRLERFLQGVFADTSKSKHIDCEINLLTSRESESITGDFDLIAIVLQNLLINAIEAIEESENLSSGKIEVWFERADSLSRVSEFITSKNGAFFIKDNGESIANKNDLFKLFKSHKTSGSGIGLSLSHKIISAHGGSIEIIEEQKSKTFIVYL